MEGPCTWQCFCTLIIIVPGQRCTESRMLQKAIWCSILAIDYLGCKICFDDFCCMVAYAVAMSIQNFYDCWSDPVYKTVKNWWSVSGICPWPLCNDSALNVSGNSSWYLLICNMSFRKSIATPAIALSSNLARLMAWPVVSLTLCMITPILFVDLCRHNTPS